MNLTSPVGIEIETGNNPHHIRNVNLLPDYWEHTTDASCGLEFRSKKLESYDSVVEACSTLNSFLSRFDYEVHHKCGVHVHLGFKHIEDLSAKYRVFRMFIAHEKLLFSIMAPHNERAHFCKILPAECKNMFKSGCGFSYWDCAQSGESRYWWFNGAAMFKHGTIEIRLMNGTTDMTKVLNFVAFLQCMMNAAILGYVKVPWDTEYENFDHAEQILQLNEKHNLPWATHARTFMTEATERLNR